MLYAGLCGYFFRCLLIIAGEHYRLYMGAAKPFYKLVNIISDNIVDSDD